MKNFVILMNSKCPLGLDILTRPEVDRKISWQVSGGARREDFTICEVRDGKLYDIASNKMHEPINGMFTADAWEDYLNKLKEGRA